MKPLVMALKYTQTAIKPALKLGHLFLESFFFKFLQQSNALTKRKKKLVSVTDTGLLLD